MLISAAQKSDLIIHIYIYSFYITFHYGLSQDIVYSFLCYTVESCYLFILYIPFASASPKFPLHSSSIPSPLAVQFSSVQSLSRVWLVVTPWTVARQASLSITNSQILLKLRSIESMMPSNYLILCHPLLFPSSIFPSIRVFSNESVLRIRWPKYWSFIFSISPSNEYSGLISFRIDWLDLLAVPGTLKRVFFNTTVKKHQFFCTQLSL